MGITGSLGFLLTQGRTDSELAASVRLHIPGMSRATVQGFGVLQGLFGSSRTAPLRGGFGLSVHFAWDNGTSISGGYMHGRGEGAAPSAIYLGGPDYHIGRETAEQSYSRPPIPNREMVPSPWPWLWEKLKQEWNEAELANEAHRRGEDWLNDECFLYEEGKYDRPLRHLGKRDATGKFCNVGGKFVPMDAPLREVGGDLVPVQESVGCEFSGSSEFSASTAAACAESSCGTNFATEQAVRNLRGRSDESRCAQTNRPLDSQKHRLHQKFRRSPHQSPLRKRQSPAWENPPNSSQKVSPTESARNPAKSTTTPRNSLPSSPKREQNSPKISSPVVSYEHSHHCAPHGARAPQRFAQRCRAHRPRPSSRCAKEWLEKPAYEKGESLGRATTAIASEVAIDVLTDGIGAVATLRKVGKSPTRRTMFGMRKRWWSGRRRRSAW
jgi:hypothetical protein